MNKRQLSVSVILLSLGIILLINLYPRINSLVALEGKNFGNSGIKEKSLDLAKNYGITLSEYEIAIQLKENADLNESIQIERGFKNSIDLIGKDLPVYFWDVKFKSKKIERPRTEQEVVKKFIGELGIKFDLSERLVELDFTPPDSMKLVALGKDVAGEITKKFIKSFTPYKDSLREISDSTKGKKSDSFGFSLQLGDNAEEKGHNSENLPNTDYRFVYETFDSLFQRDIKIETNIKGRLLTKLSIDYKIENNLEESSFTKIPKISAIIFYLLSIIIMIVIAFKKFRAYEIGFKLALTMGALAGLGLLAEMFGEIPTSISFEIAVGLVLAPGFIFLMISFIWAVGETICREVWGDKLIEFDLLRNGYFTHSKIGAGIFQGLGFGIFILSVWYLMIFLSGNIGSISFQILGKENILNLNAMFAPYLIAQNLYSILMDVIVVFLFAVSGIAKRIKSKQLLIIIAALFFAIVDNGYVTPAELDFILQFGIGLLLGIIFIKTNVFVLIFTLLSMKIFHTGFSVIYLDSVPLISMILVLLFLVIYVLYSLKTKNHIESYDSIRPKFVEFINERQRLQGELEVARNVQLSFLPKESPKVETLDIAGRCLPAYEVGGDYYDFMLHEDNKLGVIIGDVSGKGTKAAFYMTLTKGFFRAIAKNILSPAEIMKQMNTMFFENVDRGNFISMLYGIFDLDSKKFRFSRAGHNPLIIIKKDGSSKLLQPVGLALGLEKGIIFNKSIEEVAIDYEIGDLFVFYTDGFPEATNKNKEELGQERFTQIVISEREKGAQEIVDKVFEEARRFAGKSEQHDDMTLIVIKIV